MKKFLLSVTTLHGSLSKLRQTDLDPMSIQNGFHVMLE